MEDLKSDFLIFHAKIGDWQCVKRTDIDEKMDPFEIALSLTKLENSLENQAWKQIGKKINLQKLDEIAAEITGAKFNQKKKAWVLDEKITSEKIMEIWRKLKSPHVLKKMDNLGSKEEYEICKTYLYKKVFEILEIKTKIDLKVLEKITQKSQY
ncbi:MAG: DUF2666 family protein [archaeon]